MTQIDTNTKQGSNNRQLTFVTEGPSLLRSWGTHWFLPDASPSWPCPLDPMLMKTPGFCVLNWLSSSDSFVVMMTKSLPHVTATNREIRKTKTQTYWTGLVRTALHRQLQLAQRRDLFRSLLVLVLLVAQLTVLAITPRVQVSLGRESEREVLARADVREPVPHLASVANNHIDSNTTAVVRTFLHSWSASPQSAPRSRVSRRSFQLAPVRGRLTSSEPNTPCGIW